MSKSWGEQAVAGGLRAEGPRIIRTGAPRFIADYESAMFARLR